MFIEFFLELRDARVPVNLREYLTLLEAMEAGIADYSVDDLYYLSRSCLVKDETNLDKFDRVFGSVFKGLEPPEDEERIEIPADWLQKLAERTLTDEEKALIESLGGWDKLMETLKQRLEEQKGRHQGGSKWIGTAGTSPFGAWGYNPEGIRIGQDRNRNNRAVKVWDKREFKNLDASVELGTRNIKVALRRLRRFARQGAATELELHDTILSTAKKGYLDIQMVPERHNAVKVLLFLDVGGSMDSHIKTWDVLHTYPHDSKAIFVGDASMSPYELLYPGGSVEHWNEEAGFVWMERLLGVYQRAVWLNPVPEDWWEYTTSTKMMRQIIADRMYPLTLEGLDAAMRELGR